MNNFNHSVLFGFFLTRARGRTELVGRSLRSAWAPQPRGTPLPRAAAAPAGPPRGSGRVLCCTIEKEVCLRVAGGERDASDPPGAAAAAHSPNQPMFCASDGFCAHSSPKPTQTQLSPTGLAKMLPRWAQGSPCPLTLAQELQPGQQ